MLSRFGILVAAAGFVASASATAHVHHDVHRKLQSTGKVNIVVTMKETPARALRELESTTFETRGAKIEALVNRLDSHAAESQKEIDAIFAQEAAQRLYDVQDRSWALNARLIDGATIELVEKLAALPGVASIREQFVGKLAKPQVEAVNANATVKIEWGVDRIQAPSVWNQGNTGENIVVGILDTGVRWTHELIRSKMRETHNWYDPYNQSSLPLDVYGHGTHVTGTILGANGYGVAPGAKWIACLGCTADACPERIMIKCGEFFTCPTDPKGLNKDCSKAPHVINNSWGSDAGRGDKAYQPMVDAWRAAGIIPVFSLGNDGSSCSTSYPPAEYANAIGVGATNSNNVLASFSSRGPAVSGIVKPDISAPGQSVTSGWRDSDTSLRSISGTSMAGPHVAGAVALLLSAQPNLTYDAIYSRLTKTANQTILKPTTGTRTCGGIPDTKFPNNHYGYGLLNVFSAVTTKA